MCKKCIKLFFWAVLLFPLTGLAQESTPSIEQQKADFRSCIIKGNSTEECAEYLKEESLIGALEGFGRLKHTVTEHRLQLPPNWWRGGGIWTPSAVDFLRKDS